MKQKPMESHLVEIAKIKNFIRSQMQIMQDVSTPEEVDMDPSYA